MGLGFSIVSVPPPACFSSTQTAGQFVLTMSQAVFIREYKPDVNTEIMKISWRCESLTPMLTHNSPAVPEQCQAAGSPSKLFTLKRFLVLTDKRNVPQMATSPEGL